MSSPETGSVRPTLDVAGAIPENSHHIGGRWFEPDGGRSIAVLNPATGDVLQPVHRGGPGEVDLAVRAAAEAQQAWSTMNPTLRGRILGDWAELLERNSDFINLLESLEGGQPYRDGQGAGFARRLRYFAAQADKVTGLTLPTTRPDVLAFTLREPHGVCGIIVPWNSPIGMMLNGGAAALAAGNTIVVKPSEEAPLVCLLAAQLATEAGVPGGVVNVVTGLGGEAGAAIPRHPLVSHVTFTGSPAAGREVMKGCADHLIPCHLELGGKSPIVVFEDADLDRVAPTIVDSITDNAGQVCYAGTRLVLHDAIHGELVDRVASGLRKVRVGPWHADVDMGPVISERQRDRVLGYIRRGIEEGAKLVTGGGQPTIDGCTEGFFVEPTLFDQVEPSMTIAQDEIFGPVLVTQRFSTDDEAASIANDTRYGLVASVWTADVRRALTMARRVQSGQVYVNTHTHRGAIGAPFGGYKESGIGRSGGVETIHEYLRTKAVIVDGQTSTTV